jgi:dihydrofolate reductase
LGSATWRAARSEILAAPYSGRRRIVMTRDPAVFVEDAQPGRIEFTAEPPTTLASRLRMEGVEQCALLGGGVVNGLFLSAGLVDELWITIEPLLFGQGRPIADSRIDVRMALGEVTRLDRDTLLLKYSVKR